MKFCSRNKFIYLVAAVSTMFSASPATADPIAATVTINNTRITTKDGMNYAHTTEHTADFGNTLSYDSLVRFVLANGTAPLKSNGEVGFDKGLASTTDDTVPNVNHSFNPSTPVIDTGNPLQAEALQRLAQTKGVNILLSSATCRGPEKNCKNYISLRNPDGSASTVMKYSTDEVTITFPDKTSMSLTRYFSDYGPTKEAIKDLANFTGNRTPTQSRSTDYAQKFAPNVTAGSVVPELIHNAQADPVNN